MLGNPEAVKLLGPRGEKRALTYGNIETPGDAAAAAAAADGHAQAAEVEVKKQKVTV